MDDELKVTVTVRGARNPYMAVNRIVALLKRSLYLIDGDPGVFSARIEAPGRSIELGGDGQWKEAESGAVEAHDQ